MKLPENPRQGDVVEWWTRQDHPVKPYVQRHRATYYVSAPCVDVLGDRYRSGAPFDHEWLIESWYEPSGGKASGGRNTTDGLRYCLITGPSGGGVHATWAAARDAAVAATRSRAAEFRSIADRLEREAAALAAVTPEPVQKAREKGNYEGTP